MAQITKTQSDIHGSLSGNTGDDNVFGNDNSVANVQMLVNGTSFVVVNQGGPLRAGDGEAGKAYKPYRIVPYSRNSMFTGRDSIIELVKEFSKSKDHNRIALQGLGGSGKTQIALEYVYQRAKDSECDVFWVHGSGVLKFSQSFRTIAQRVHIPQASARTDEEGLLSSIRAWFEGPDSGDWILVIDNADNEDDFRNNGSPISKFVPQGHKGTVIFTTRSQLVASRQGCNLIKVDKMANQEARELFLKCFRNWDSLEDEELDIIPMILDSLDYLPLAVVGAAAFMTETNTPPSIYWSIFQKDDKGRKKLLLQEFSDIRREVDVTESIISTYFITPDRLIEQMPTAACLLRLIACFDRQNIPEELLSQCGLQGINDSIDFRLAIGKLLGFSLVTDVKRDGKRFYELHRLVQLSIHAYLSTEELNHWKTIALQVISRLFPRDEIDWRYGGTAASYIPHARAVSKHASDSVAEELCFCLARYFYYMGSYGDAEIQTRRCIALRDADKKHGWVGEYWSRSLLLAKVSRYQGRLKQAEEMLRQVLSDIEKVLGPDHPCTLGSANHLASVLQGLGRYSESETIFRRALEGNEKVRGPHHPDTLASVNNLALVLQDLGRYDESEVMLRRAVEGSEKILGADHPSTLASINNLAMVLQNLRRFGGSETMLRRALEGNEKFLGPHHPDTLASVNNLALVLQDLGRYDESEVMLRRAVEGSKKILGADHPDTLTSVNNLGMMLRDLGRYSESEAMLRRAVEGSENILGADHPFTLASVNNLASVLQDL